MGHTRFFYIFLAMLLVSFFAVNASPEPGLPIAMLTAMSLPAVSGSLTPVVTETGQYTLSVDALGMLSSSGTIYVDKPTGATVKSAYLAAASRGYTGSVIPDGAITLNGVAVNWDISTPSTITSNNYMADVTSHVKSTIDSASAGLVGIPVTETSSSMIDGSILAVIFEDPNVGTQTVVLLFGAQDIAGDSFSIGLAEPVNKSAPGLVMDMSLGISYGFQGDEQYSIIDVNGDRLTTSAGGQDDGESYNGALITAGGIGDSNANPANPNALPTNPRSDDELYNLIPFVDNGDTSILVETSNPSNDDNIFFGSFVLSTAAVVGEGILLSPINAVNPLNTEHTVTAKVQDDDGNPIVGRLVTFEIVSGPNSGLTAQAMTDANGEASMSYTGDTEGTDVIVASFIDNQKEEIFSNRVTKTWGNKPGPGPSVPEFTLIGAGLVLLAAGLYIARKR